MSDALIRQSGDGPMPTQAISGGRRPLSDLPAFWKGQAMLFAEKEGFRFQRPAR